MRSLRFFAVAATAAVLAGASFLAPTAQASKPKSWPLSRAFLASSKLSTPGNPFGPGQVWRAGFENGVPGDDTEYETFPTVNGGDFCYKSPPIVYWQNGQNNPDSGGAIMDTANVNVLKGGCTGSEVIARGQPLLEPGDDTPVFFGWTSPFSGTVKIAASFLRRNCGAGQRGNPGVQWSIEKASPNTISDTVLRTGILTTCPQTPHEVDLSTSVTRGMSLYFIAGPLGGGSYYEWDLTQIGAKITRS